ncbi:hypothetical protein AVEN_105095-1 [Araneus ventricosus]|uniref:Uncharacterized protein n=1 Tax=Araneus ventricosus TaxID=182803 RepID=A0A4Y2K3W5_ARAVE|nr:hypothetical protein AVEN_105095-1 [Araneus ventricosus]
MSIASRLCPEEVSYYNGQRVARGFVGFCGSNAGGHIPTAINPQRRMWKAETWTFGTGLFYLYASEKLTIEKEFSLFSLSYTHFLGSKLSYVEKAPLAIGQAGNLASPPLAWDIINRYSYLPNLL